MTRYSRPSGERILGKFMTGLVRGPECLPGDRWVYSPEGAGVTGKGPKRQDKVERPDPITRERRRLATLPSLRTRIRRLALTGNLLIART